MSRIEKGRAVAIVGVGDTRFGKQKSIAIAPLAVSAARDALRDANLEAEALEAIYVGNFGGEVLTGDALLGSLIANRLGITGVPATRIEGACASGGLSVQAAIQAVRYGMVDTAMAIGVEKMTSQSTGVTTQALASAGDQAREMSAGATFPSLFGLIARAHMDRYGTTRDQIASVSVKNRKYGALNPRAHFQAEIELNQVIESRPIADPLRLLDCPPISDGAAAVIVTTLERALDLVSDRAVNVAGMGQASGPVALSDALDVTQLEAPQAAAQRAYADAGLSASDMQAVEVHDCFSISEILAIEALGIVPRGEGGAATQSGFTAGGQGGPLVNSSGGLLSKGHPIGATGTSQVVELVRHLRGEAQYRAFGGSTVGLAYNMGGAGAVATVTILERN